MMAFRSQAVCLNLFDDVEDIVDNANGARYHEHVDDTFQSVLQ